MIMSNKFNEEMSPIAKSFHIVIFLPKDEFLRAKLTSKVDYFWL